MNSPIFHFLSFSPLPTGFLLSFVYNFVVISSRFSSVNECSHSGEPSTHSCQRCHSVFVFLALSACSLSEVPPFLFQPVGVFRVLKAALGTLLMFGMEIYLGQDTRSV